jgi:hypothetical protein
MSKAKPTTKTIKLLEPIKLPGRCKVTLVKLRAPTFRDYFDIGEIRRVGVRVRDGAIIVTENVEAIDRYLRRCLIAPEYSIVGQAACVDGYRIKRALLEFFRA